MSKVLVTFFSASGVTARVAQNIANNIGADIFEIKPKVPYTSADLNWLSWKSRSSIEMKDKSSRPEIVNKIENLDNYETIVIGFPVWWYTAPTIINTFIEENDLSNKKIYVFVTSGSSSHAKSCKELKERYPNVNFVDAKRFKGKESDNDYIEWIK